MRQTNLSIDIGATVQTDLLRYGIKSGFAPNGLLTPPIDDDELYRAIHLQDQAINGQQPVTIPQVKVAVIGVGYVGLHLVTAFAAGYQVVAYDIDEARLSTVAASLHGLDVQLTSRDNDLRSASHFVIAVPTTLHHDKTVDTRHLCAALNLVERHAQPGATVIIESSVAVGMTRSLLGPIMRRKGLKGGMSPERVDPGRAFPAYQDIPKIISGLDDITQGSLTSIQSLYQKVFGNLVTVSRPEVAEMTKLYENCQRMMCIAYANEMADACEELDLDYAEVCAAARTKPFGYQPYSPGLGIGGHCIPVNPYYLLSTSKFPLLEAATERMMERPARVCDRVMKRWYKQQHSDTYLHNQRARGRMSGRPRVLVVGIGFKRGQSVQSNSPGVAFIRHLLSDDWDAYVEYADPLVRQEELSWVPRFDEQYNWNHHYITSHFDIVVVAVDQVGLDMEVLQQIQGDTLVEDFSATRIRTREEVLIRQLC